MIRIAPSLLMEQLRLSTSGRHYLNCLFSSRTSLDVVGMAPADGVHCWKWQSSHQDEYGLNPSLFRMTAILRRYLRVQSLYYRWILRPLSMTSSSPAISIKPSRLPSVLKMSLDLEGETNQITWYFIKKLGEIQVSLWFSYNLLIFLRRI